MPLDPTQEPIFPPELLVGDAPRKGSCRLCAMSPLETCFISYPLGTLYSPCPSGLSLNLPFFL